MQSLLTTVAHRPYVFLFLASFLVIGILNRGLSRTLLFLVLGYIAAFFSEFSSIRNGFPYGLYHYVYENLQGELLLGGVPVWDSLSYVFLAYASYEMANFNTPLLFNRLNSNPPLTLRGGYLIKYWRSGGGCYLAAFLMMLLDVVIDPLAVRGDRWFLGRIFYYPEGGIYFGVPLSNFAGWFLVALVIFGSYRFLEKRVCKKPPPLRAPILGPLFYFGILLFNLAITFVIGEWRLALAGLAIHLPAAMRIMFFRQSTGRVRF